VLELLLANGAYVNQVTEGETALDVADHDGISATLLAAGSLSGLPLTCTRVFDNREGLATLKELIGELGGKGSWKLNQYSVPHIHIQPLDATRPGLNDLGVGSLFSACHVGNRASAEVFLDWGVDPNATGSCYPPLYWASSRGYGGTDSPPSRQVVELLLERNADVNQVTDGETAIMAAEEQGHEGTIAVLRAARTL